ncbi:SRPBCC domain-containing protein [Mycobacterium sp. NPDC050853]|uniref:SRPBCC family protein n=1 Tax=Mycobacteriaceae TaxID=1762 RepID=UPI0015DF0728|nr:SRPBCC domain-containing protein [Mycobacteroides sp. LB1]
MVEQVGDLTSIGFEYHYSCPASGVWSVLTSPSLFGQWVKDFDPVRYEKGVAFSFNVFPFVGSGFVGAIDGRFTDAVVDRLLAYRLATRDGSITIDSRWSLSPDAEGTRLVVDATGFDPGDHEQMKFRQLCAVGWPAVLDRIDEILRERSTP